MKYIILFALLLPLTTSKIEMNWYNFSLELKEKEQITYDVNMKIKVNHIPKPDKKTKEVTVSTIYVTINALVNIEVVNFDRENGIYTIKVRLNKLEGMYNTRKLNADDVYNITSIGTDNLVSNIFNRVGLVIPPEPVEINNKWEQPVPAGKITGEPKPTVKKPDIFFITKKGNIIREEKHGKAKVELGGTSVITSTFADIKTVRGYKCAEFNSKIETEQSFGEGKSAYSLKTKGNMTVYFSLNNGRTIQSIYKEKCVFTYNDFIQEQEIKTNINLVEKK